MQEMLNRSGSTTSTTNAANRIRRIGEIANRYVGNITKQRDYQRNIKAMYNAYENSDPALSRLNADVAENRRYTKRVYAQGQSIG